jgi:glycosyltransferase involved in cell wall biosynthesis
MKAALILSSTDVFPADSGNKVVLAGFISHLKAELGAENVLYLHVGRRPSNVRACGCRYEFVPIPYLALRAAQVLWHAFIRRRRSIQEALFMSNSLRAEIHRKIGEFQPDLIIFDTVRMASCAWAPQFRQKAILYLDDLYSIRYRRALAQSRVDVLGTFAHYLPSWMRSIISVQAIQRRLLRFEADLIERSERFWPQCFFRSLLINESESRLLSQRCPNADVQTVDPLLLTELPPVISSSRIHQRMDPNPKFVFLGALEVAHNESGLFEFLKTWWPACMHAIPNARLSVIGKRPSARLKELAAQYPDSVVLEGYVERLDDVLGRATALIAPILYGSGVKLKVIDALARGLPVVSTEIGVHGIPIEHGRHGYVLKHFAEFPRYMQLISDPDVNVRMREACFRLFSSRYGWESVNNRYSDLFSITSRALDKRIAPLGERQKSRFPDPDARALAERLSVEG